ncbi:putative signal transducing protein [Polaribacter aquimarinus]|uniref:DUF2007 domain-containing protein n=1 Tax=Polaribacter aquimarinus TaxID=2100726 RepID=A0A2U2J773_9FLAO|nr:DUF2007 domain-containing protein [Polaribacter aquimarinus]PWG04193.1 hypothetical protein DIS07_14620 [Polaribacter aquimarinus]
MATEHIKIFSGSSIIVRGLQNLLDDNKIHYIIKDNFESARLAGFGEQMNAVEVHILSSDKQKAEPIVEKYRKEINS